MPPSFYSRDTRVEQSLRHSIRDGAAYSVMVGSGETYFSAYALFLKATTAQIGLLAALPSLLGSLAQVISAWVAGFARRRKIIILYGVLIQALIWLPIIWLPYFFPQHAVTVVITCVAIYYAAGNFTTPAWNSLMGDLVPERKRGRFFARRTQLMSIMTFLALIGAGGFLHYLEHAEETQIGFMLAFSLAALARLYSAYHLAHMHEPEREPKPMELPTWPGFWQRLQVSDFARFTLFFGAMNFAVSIASPFFTVYMLRDLNFTYLQFTASMGISVLAQFLTLNMWGRFGDIFGHRRVMTLTGALIPILPALWLLSSEFWYILFIQTFAGLCWAGFTLSVGNFLFDVMPVDRRAGYAAIHNVFCNSAIFAGALIGGYLSTIIPAKVSFFGYTLQWTSGLWGVILISSLARAVVALTFLHRIREVREVRPVSAGGLMIRVIRFNVLSELVIDLLGLRRRRRRTEVPAAAPLAEAVPQQHESRVMSYLTYNSLLLKFKNLFT